MDRIVISTGFSRFEKNWRTSRFTVEELCEKLSSTIRTPETAAEYAAMAKPQRDNLKDHGGFVGGKLRGSRRLASTVEYRSLITLDLDACPEGYLATLIQKIGYDCFVYTTHSHTPTSPRYRVLVFLARNISPDEYNAIAHYLAHDLGTKHVDPCSFRVHQLMYWPTTPADGEYFARRFPAPTLDPDAFLAAHPNWRDLADLPPSERETASFTGEKRTAADPLTKQNVVGLFCRAYTIEDVIDTMNRVRKHITFYGWVQGVGFRYRARHAAELYGCTGWVRNEWDGNVTMEIQGTEEAIDKVILAIKRGRYIRIENMDSQTIPPDEDEYGFRTE